MERNGIVGEVAHEYEQVMPSLLGAEGDGLHKLEDGLAHRGEAGIFLQSVALRGSLMEEG